MRTMLRLPPIDPVAFTVLSHDIRWYSLAYMGGLLYTRRQLARGLSRNVDFFLLGAVLSMYLWGRVTFELVYDSGFALAHPLEVLAPRDGGLAFHGSLIGIALATWAVSRNWKVPFLAIADEIATAVPLGIALGRIGNFINQELYGRITDLPWGVVFPAAGPEPRHPSQLYEALLEGVLLFAIMRWFSRRAPAPQTGRRTALFLALYALARFVCEAFRQPDPAVGFVAFGLSMGQLLSFVMVVAGCCIMVVPMSDESPPIRSP